MACLGSPPSTSGIDRIPYHRLVEANKHEWRRRLAAIAELLSSPRPKQAVDGLMLLVGGVYAMSQTLGGLDGPAGEIVGATEAILTGAFALERRFAPRVARPAAA